MTDIQHIDTPVKRKRGRPRKIRDGVNRNSQVNCCKLRSFSIRYLSKSILRIYQKKQ